MAFRKYQKAEKVEALRESERDDAVKIASVNRSAGTVPQTPKR